MSFCVLLVLLCCAKCCSAAQFVCMLFQYRHRISNNLKIFVQLLNVSTIPFQLYFNFNKAFCDYSAFPNFQIVYPFRINQVVRFSRNFFFHFIFAFFEITLLLHVAFKVLTLDLCCLNLLHTMIVKLFLMFCVNSRS